jgi:Rab GDP dissociation inhibitor
MMGMLEKPRFINFINFVVNWDPAKPSTLQGLDPKRHSMEQVYQKFGLAEQTVDFIGHAVAMFNNDSYLKQPCGPAIDKMKLYVDSLMQIGGSPFIYPLYGLGGLPEGFSRLAAINRGTYMLHKPVDGFEYDEQGKVCGVRSGDEVAKCKMVICDPSYAKSEKSTPTARIIRKICILGAPIPDTKTKEGTPALSVQIIMPQKQFKPPRKNDIYVMMVSWAHSIAAKDKYVAIVSTVCETADPEKEIEPAVKLLGPVIESFTSISEFRVPTDDGTKDQVFVTSSYDPTSHFEDASTEVLAMWKTITGEDLDLTAEPDPEEDQ